MKTINIEDIRQMVECEIIKLTKDNKYYDNTLCAGNEAHILTLLKDHFGYDYELDSQRDHYCLGASQIEIWEYYLDTILPSLNL